MMFLSRLFSSLSSIFYLLLSGTLRLAHLSALFRAVLRAPFGRVVASQDDVRKRRRGSWIRESRRNWLHVAGLIVTWRRGWERSGALDQSSVILQPLAVIESDGGHDAAPPTIRSREAPFLDGALRNDDLIAERADADALDVDTELA